MRNYLWRLPTAQVVALLYSQQLFLEIQIALRAYFLRTLTAVVCILADTGYALAGHFGPPTLDVISMSVLFVCDRACVSYECACEFQSESVFMTNLRGPASIIYLVAIAFTERYSFWASLFLLRFR